jgi:hypothetical protein
MLKTNGTYRGGKTMTSIIWLFPYLGCLPTFFDGKVMACFKVGKKKL